jgi:hypothetical protein
MAFFTSTFNEPQPQLVQCILLKNLIPLCANTNSRPNCGLSNSQEKLRKKQKSLTLFSQVARVLSFSACLGRSNVSKQLAQTVNKNVKFLLNRSLMYLFFVVNALLDIGALEQTNKKRRGLAHMLAYVLVFRVIRITA